MVQLKQITRNATFAWAPAEGKPLIASGTIAGAVDASFSQDSELEIWNLDLDNSDISAFELKPTAKVSTERKFYSLAWGYVTPEKPRGVIAGAMDDGHLNIWDVNSILNNNGATALIASNHTHQGAIKAVDFNPVNPKLLMSAGSGGEFNIWDMEKPSQPYPAPSRGQRVDDIEAASWNRKVANILATASTNGFTSVWDLKQSREILHLQAPGRRRVSTLAWDPDNPTRIITGCGDDTAPALYVWDLRNSNAPALTLEGHSAGILSVSWCQRDHDLLLSCGKDNRTILWNPQVPKVLGEFPVASTWAFETQWCPQNPDILANATFEGKITVHRLQSTVTKSEVNGTQAGGEDFFNQRQYVSEGGFELKRAPKWLQVPCSASFGFGGSLVSVKNTKRKGEIKISKYVSEPKISENAAEFEEAIQSADWTKFCEKQIEKSRTDSERGNWEVLKLLFDAEPRKRLIEYLGIKETDLPAALLEEVEALSIEKTVSESTAVGDNTLVVDETPSIIAPEEGKSNRLSGIFGTSGATDDFLSQLNTPITETHTSAKGPFSMTSPSDTESDKMIVKAILSGRFDMAVDICLRDDRLSDAFLLATQGDVSIQKKVQDAYFSRNIHRSSYQRLLQSVMDSNLRDIAENADLAGWKESLVFFCTFAKADEEFAELCEVLGQRLENQGKVEDAKICYLAGKKLDRVVDIWIAEANAQEEEELKSTPSDSSFSIHARALQGFVEKVTVLKQTKGTTGGNLKALYEKYTEFVEIVASQGNLSVAQKYIELVPAESAAVKAVKERLSRATAKATAPAATTKPGLRPNDFASPGRQPPVSNAFAARSQPPVSNTFTPAQISSSHSRPFAASPYTPAAPSTSVPAPGPGTSSAHSRGSAYTPSMTSAPYASPYSAAPFNPYNPGVQAVNPTLSRIADLPPPPPKKTTENWNDPPMLSNPARTRTPVASLVKPSSPFTGASPVPSPGFQQKPPVGPPPTTAKPPQRVKSPPASSPLIGNAEFARNQMQPGMPPQGSMYPSQINQPPPTRAPMTPQPPPPPPPTGQFRAQTSPPQSRPQYAPIPINQNTFSPPPPSSASKGPPPTQYPPPPRNQYAPAAVVTPQQDEPPLSAPVKATPPPPKFPSGDRSHIPATSRPVYDIFSTEMNRIKQLAQAPQQKRIVVDVEKRLNILFDLLNNNEGIPLHVISELVKLAQALSQRQYEVAQQIQLELHTANEQFSTWMLGIRRLIDMARAFA